MKKLGIALLALLVLAGCSRGNKAFSKEEAKALYEAAVNTTSQNKADFEMFTVSEEGESSVKMQFRNMENFSKAEAYMEMSAEGLEMAYYLQNGAMYVDMFGMKVKTEISEEDFADTFDINDVIGESPADEDFDFDLFTYEVKGDLVIYTLDSKSDLVEEVEGLDGTVVFTINRKTKQTVKYEFDLTEDDSKVKMTADFDPKGKIVFPDFSTYESIDDLE